MTPPKNIIERLAATREASVQVAKREPSEVSVVVAQLRTLGAEIVDALNRKAGSAPEIRPVVNVAAPIVHVDAAAAHVVPRHWRLEVTSRDVPYGRIKTISIEAID